MPQLNSPSLIQRLYEEERPVRYRPGTILLYQLNAWHRGTPPLPGKLRIIHHIVWRRAAAEWIAWQAYPTPMSAMPPKFLARMTPVQRGLFGFPAPGNSYWDTDTVEAVGKRYPTMDMQPYRAALAQAGGGPKL